MQTINFRISIDYRGNKKLSKTDRANLNRRIQDLFLPVNKEELFKTSLIYAGWNLSHDNKEDIIENQKLYVNKISKSAEKKDG